MTVTNDNFNAVAAALAAHVVKHGQREIDRYVGHGSYCRHAAAIPRNIRRTVDPAAPTPRAGGGWW